jgi:hypothetical protein
VQPVWDIEGFAIVTLKRGPHAQLFYLDSLVAAAFNGTTHSMTDRPLHADGVAWNNWANNLLWGLKSMPSGENLVTDWIGWSDGKRLHGPLSDRRAIIGGSRPGDIIVGHNKQRKVVAFEVMFSRNTAMSPRNPFDLAEEYRATAKMHSDHFWSIMLSEAAEVIDALGHNVLDRVVNGDHRQLALPVKRKAVVAAPPSQELYARPPIKRAPIAPIPSRIQRKPIAGS